jgi:hypothetical protein
MSPEITSYAAFIENTVGDADWLAEISHAAWDVKTNTLTFRFPESGDPREGYHTLLIGEVEADYPLIRQALRVANVTCRTDRARGDALASWSHLLGSGMDAPLFLFKKSDGTSTALGMAWARRLKHVDLVGGSVDLHIALSDNHPVGASKEAHQGSGFGQRIVNANFPGMVKAVRRGLDLGMSTSETADYVKREIIYKSPDGPIDLPELQP